MIGYGISRAALEKLIEKESPGWIANATARTAAFRTAGRYSEKSSIWSKVKPVYMRLQGNSKCAYCERKLESVAYGKGEQDVEHFRPKRNVRPWKVGAELTKAGIVATVPPARQGYHLLAYHPFNYAAACKPCNSALKKDYFPIAGAYKMAGQDPGTLVSEKPLLIYPVGDFDDDPEDVVEFHGASPRPRKQAGHRRDRALVSIAFFRLDDVGRRKNLFRERAVVIIALYPQLEKLARKTARASARKLVDGFTSTAAPHTNCARSFARLFARNRAEAQSIFEQASTLVISSS